MLEAARGEIAGHEGEEIRLALREGEVAGTLVSAGGEIVVRAAEGERAVLPRDLAAASRCLPIITPGSLAGFSFGGRSSFNASRIDPVPTSRLATIRSQFLAIVM